jgi:ferredoxin
MITIEVECEQRQCGLSDYAYVRALDIIDGAPLSGCVPDGWRVLTGMDGLARALCPSHAHCYAKARSGYEYDTFAERQRAKDAERFEREQLARLKAKYEPAGGLGQP